MASVADLQPLSLNPLATGIGIGGGLTQLAQQGLKTRLLGATLPEQIAATNAQNQGVADTADAMAKARLGLTQEQLPYLTAQTRGLQNRNALTSGTLASTIAATNEANKLKQQYPLLSQPGVAGQMGAYQYLEGSSGQPGTASQPPVSSGSPLGGAPYSPQIESQLQSGQPLGSSASAAPQNNNAKLAKMLLGSVNSQTDKNNAMTGYYQARTQGYNFSQLPSEWKNSNFGYTNAMGLTPLQAMQEFRQGKTIADIANERGYNLANLTPVYTPTSKTLSTTQQRNQAVAEVNAISPQVTAALAPYSRRFMGFSPKQIGQALTNTDPNSVAKYIAARALAPELAGMRMRAQGGQLGVEAIKEISDKTYGRLGNFQGSISPQTFTLAQNYIDQWIDQATHSANQQATQIYGHPQQPVSGTPSLAPAQPLNASNSTIRIQAPDGKTYNVPQAEAQAAIAAGGKRLG